MARRLLTLAAMTALATSCILPPPPSDDSDEIPTLTVASQLATPRKPKVALLRGPQSSQTFSVGDAVVVPPGAELPNVYWFVGYDVSQPLPEIDRGLDFTITGCDERISGTSVIDTEAFTVEALITYGNIVFDSSREDDFRVTQGGEIIITKQWTLEVTGDASQCGVEP